MPECFVLRFQPAPIGTISPNIVLTSSNASHAGGPTGGELHVFLMRPAITWVWDKLSGRRCVLERVSKYGRLEV
eukprot:517048-Amphidinium_carterae.1